MQPHVQNHNSQTVSRLGSARVSLRHLRHNFSSSFWKAKKQGTPSSQEAAEVLEIEPTTDPNPSLEAPSFDTDIPYFSPIMDGATERMARRNNMSQTRPANVAAIFVHAGAGYHSTTNEHIHLGACDSAARMAMKILRAGGTAVDAVEAAIKVLEDKEITNAGYGSNLAIDGVVECDATIVDHLGRSGACGATAQIKNPIHLARKILDASSRPLSLRRVPPNLLVGQGATDFAWEYGIPVLPHEMLVSRNARDRFIRWRDDLKRAEGRMTPISSASGSQAGDEERLDPEYEARVQARQRRDHTLAILNGTWNEGQGDSPRVSPQLTPIRDAPSQEPGPTIRSSPGPAPGVPTHYDEQGDFPSNSKTRLHSPSGSPSKRPRYGTQPSEERLTHSLLGLNGDTQKSAADVAMSRNSAFNSEARPGSSDGPTTPPSETENSEIATSRMLYQEGTAESPSKLYIRDDDVITDTVGAIAIDMYGRIAAGSSSGGIGMKHRGRVGPAALVGIGTAVIPADEADDEGICVAAVTSGTGEHMATTMASQKCAERLYHNTRRALGGGDIEATEEEAMQSFVLADFMGHPGVAASNSAGAIGVMAVKKTPYGYFLHFAHNTDSFALASMHSNERDAKCVMSRAGDHGNCVRGGRKVRVD